jgi:hypothetical protein
MSRVPFLHLVALVGGDLGSGAGAMPPAAKDPWPAAADKQT